MCVCVWPGVWVAVPWWLGACICEVHPWHTAHGVEGMEVCWCVLPEDSGALAQGPAGTLLPHGEGSGEAEWQWTGSWGPASLVAGDIALPGGTWGPTAESLQTPALPPGPTLAFGGWSSFFSFPVTCSPSFLNLILEPHPHSLSYYPEQTPKYFCVSSGKIPGGLHQSSPHLCTVQLGQLETQAPELAEARSTSVLPHLCTTSTAE